MQNALGDVLAEALSQVAKKRPADPIQYVADYLHSVSSDDSQRLGSKGMIINLFFTLYKNYDNIIQNMKINKINVNFFLYQKILAM